MILWLAVACASATDDSGGAPGPADSGDTADTGSTPLAFDETTDVVIVGAGVAGLTAAIEARAAGADVVVIERETAAGGAANWAGGLMMFSGSPEQAAAGVEDSPELLAAEWPAFTGGDPADPWFQFFAQNNVGMVRDWLGGFGVAWGSPNADPSTGGTRRVQQLEGNGPALVTALLDQLSIDDLRFESTAEALLVAEGRVVGLRWSDAGGTHTLGADAVVVATGGFLHDLDRVRTLFPDIDPAVMVYGSFTGADGSGLQMLQEVGATTQNLQAIGFYAHGTMSPAGGAEEAVSLTPSYYPWVNLSGERFADEAGLNSFIVGRTRAEQPGGLVWFVADANQPDSQYVSPATGAVYTLDDLVDAGVATEAESVPALAGSLGIDATALQTTLDAWNDAAIGVVEDPWRDPDYPSGLPVLHAPYYAVPVAVSVAKAFGGVDVDLQGRVLDTDGDVIPGVYAAGEVSGMAGGSLVGDYGFTGSLTAVVLGGRVAGQNAGAEAVAR